MELSEKLRKARLEAGLSQRQLCADVITRNMLSQIENGSAQPSLPTLQYLARQLGKPVSYFLDEVALELPTLPRLEQARAFYAQGKPEDALLALSMDDPDEALAQEWWLLEYLATLAAAEQYLENGKPKAAQGLLKGLENHRGIYITQPLQLHRLRLLARCGDPTPLPTDDLPLLHRARAALAEKDYEQAVLLLTAAQEQDDPQWQLLRGEADFHRGLYATAAACYRRAEEAFPEQVIPRLEICYRELGDFQLAYAYAIKLRSP